MEYHCKQCGLVIEDKWTEYIGYIFCNIICQAKYRAKMLRLVTIDDEEY